MWLAQAPTQVSHLCIHLPRQKVENLSLCHLPPGCLHLTLRLPQSCRPQGEGSLGDLQWGHFSCPKAQTLRLGVHRPLTPKTQKKEGGLFTD